MKRVLAVLGLLIALGGGAASAQARVSVSLSFGAPFVPYHPYARTYGYHRYHDDRYYDYRYHDRYYDYDPRATIVVVRPYRAARVIVVRHPGRRHHRRW